MPQHRCGRRRPDLLPRVRPSRCLSRAPSSTPARRFDAAREREDRGGEGADLRRAARTRWRALAAAPAVRGSSSTSCTAPPVARAAKAAGVVVAMPLELPRPGGLRVRPRRPLARPRRGVRARLREGAGALQPRRRRARQRPPAPAAAGAVGVAARARPQVPLRAGRRADRRAARGLRRRALRLRRDRAAAADARRDRAAAGGRDRARPWKVEGIDAPGDARAVVAQARADGRDHVLCTVLGAGADDARVGRWLRTAAAVDGFAGFAIGGRSGASRCARRSPATSRARPPPRGSPSATSPSSSSAPRRRPTRPEGGGA